MSRAYHRSPLANRTVEEPSVNLTPLIDVVFVILIMFIVIAPLLELDRIELADASQEASHKPVSAQENSPISIHVRRDNSLWIGNKAATMSELKAYLNQAKRKYPKARPQLYHDCRASFGTYQAIKNAAEMAGFHQMDVILKPS